MSKSGHKRSLDTLKEEHEDVAEVSGERKKEKIDGKGKDDSNGMLMIDEEEEDDDVAFDIKKFLQIKEDDKKSEVTVSGLKELAALKDRNDLAYSSKDGWCFHILPQFPQTRVKDEEMQKYLRPPDWVPPKNTFSEQEMAQLSEYMVDKNGEAKEKNIDWHKVLNGGPLVMDVIPLLARIPRDIAKDAVIPVLHKNEITIAGYDCGDIGDFVVAFKNLLKKSNSFLEKNSHEPIKIYVPDYGDDESDETKYYHVINFIPQ